jgi:uncharacterized protein DUF4255
MATYRAVGATCEAIVRLLQQSWKKALFNDHDLQFKVYQTADFAQPMSFGVSLFLYRAAIHTAQRTPPSRPGPNGKPRRPQLPLELHLLLTPWASDASLAHEILGWMMRTIESTPILPAGLLNSSADGVFAADETVELVPGQLSNEELFRIWDVIDEKFHVSAPYIARVVRIDSEIEEPDGGPVLTRELDFGALKRA